MKTAVTVLLTLALTAAKLNTKKKEAAIAIHEECVKTTGIEAEDIIKAMEKGIAEDPKIKEHMFCFQKALGIIDDDDFIEDEDRAKEIVEKCYDQKDDKLETAYAMGICMHHEIHSE
ncbi:hypothetical protein NQ317_011939 [Molorchus minor]|uniref:Uncharacterized protein n=1 Tax=Molorchus minor TaxID=1323400 RepID=A0ABQ9IUK4_9CUCU|nr:hypothetical protein NQ317_011939 [Molorchus minor]